ncbi:MAG: mobilization protein [Betaproteobacteria bacterium]|nr:mobilization protein [Betaproteobacteria bacterium]
MRERSAMLTLRVTPEEAMLIRHLADAALLTVSAYLRTKALGGDVYLPRLQSLQAELRRQGGLLKHLSAQGALSAQPTAQALADWQRAVRSIEEMAHARQGHRP